MSNFKAKTHQIRFRLGLRPRPRWGELTALPRPIAGFKEAASRQGGGRNVERDGRRMGREGKGGEGRERKGREGQEKGTEGMGENIGWDGKGRERESRKGREREEWGYSPPKLHFLAPPLQYT